MPFPIEEQYIQTTEQELGFTFPQSFRQKMMNNNGGEIEIQDEIWQIFPFFDQSDTKRKIRTCNHIIYETKRARKWKGFPEEAIAIAENGCGDFLIFIPENILSSANAESVFMWLHETSEIEKIADNFQSLL